MIKKFSIYIFILTGMLLVFSTGFAQSGREFRRSAIMRGNLVKTVFGNWGVIGQPGELGSRGAWIYDNNGYIGDVSPLVSAEVTTVDTSGKPVTFHSSITCPIARPTLNNEQSPQGVAWGFEPVSGYINESKQSVALYSDPNSWPAYWPDKITDPDDPGWPGAWNGFFGKTTTAAEEAFYIVDDNQDQEFNVARYNNLGVEFQPDSMNFSKNGLGLQMKVRGMQWKDFLAQDNIFWLYEITNNSTTDYSKVVFGMLVGTYVGVTSTEDYHEYDDDYSFYDVEEDIVFTADFDDNVSRNPLWKGDVGVVGYAFLESPGNEYDGIDNDGDAESNPAFPASGPYFTEDEFRTRTVSGGEILIIIDNKYNRTQFIVPDDDFVIQTRGAAPQEIAPGFTQLVEGNVIKSSDGKDILNPNAYDGIDNDYDGIVDENYYLHYRQLRKDQNGKILINKLSPVRHKDYIRNLGLADVLIDEGRNDGLDNDGDWDPEFDDVGADGISGTGDTGENDGLPTNGEPNFDRTDVDESDQIGLTSFQYFTPARDMDLSDDERLWRSLSPGLFEVPESIQNNKPVQGEDGDFFYGSGYFPLLAGETKWFSLALVYGEGGGPEVDIVDLMKNRKTVQKIYDSDYRFPPPPNKPTLTVVPGDGKVTLYWDRKAEESYDPVLKVKDFEGYKIYKATDNNFNDVFKITNADGNISAYKPLAQFDLKNGIQGYFYPKYDLYQDYSALSFKLGEDSGLEHSFVDTDVENGQRYFYAVVAYDRGDADNDVFPKENDFRIDILPSGEVATFQNTAVVIPNAPSAGYDRKIAPDSSVQILTPNAVGTGNLYYKVIDEKTVTQRYDAAMKTANTNPQYQVEFWDTSNDGVDNDNDWDADTDDLGSDGLANTYDADATEGNQRPDPGEPNLDAKDPDELFVPITTFYRVQDLVGVAVKIVGRDTLPVSLPHKNIIQETITLKDAQGNAVPATNYVVDAELGRIQGRDSQNKLLYGATYTVSYRYFPVYKSPYMEGSIFEAETKDTEIFDGLRLIFQNDWSIAIDKARSGWSDTSRAMDYTLKAFDTYYGNERVIGLQHPSDYEVQFFDEKVFDTYDIPRDPFDRSVKVNFKVYNITDQKYIDFSFNEIDGNGKISDLDRLVFVERGSDNVPQFTWELTFLAKEKGKIHDYKAGDTFRISMNKPFRSGDAFTFATVKPEIVTRIAETELENIKVVPNPYIVATAHELPLPPAITSGRGERKIDFIHLPVGAKVSIFTSRGEHVVSLEHDQTMLDGSLSWNLKTKENLDVAPGVYFYVVESTVGSKKGKIAIIK